mmetsp:Transcript_29126/g.27915  ORF Transcript_29126/g.27915 Transcript_29126/m.27915 type:complete len:197 (-) Transcript_29126:36-626(-)|eukprot:CAMPEP_0119045196 /NCGR_PEP_ID=MMETSP1177-20130426/37881_1 /TAXON_ID=2985 /ORGANISM="Ochromonas sp, Strain CCMP1899" /LENGTH=196 /DNA_ID=CAMNT_0007016539 /DNA_START=69 /DNA_END=659 /DNA_ORIENTATION=-
MEFLNNNDDDDDNDESQEDILIAPVRNKWTELSDDDEEGEIEKQSCQDTADQVTSILPKAVDLFSSVSTKFININNTNEDHIATFASSMTVEETSKYRKYNPTVDPVIEAKVINKSIGVVNVNTEVPKTTVADKMSSLGANKKGPTRPILAANNEKDKDTAKDRVKRQRLSGQSGIGSDFKTWKSDEEMKQRQQYD